MTTMALKQVIVEYGQAVQCDGMQRETLMPGQAGGASNLRADLEKRVVLFEDRDGEHIVPFERCKRLTLAPRDTPAKAKV